MTFRTKGIWLVLMASALWAATGPLTKLLRLHGFGLADILAWRYLIGCLSLLAYSRALTKPPSLRVDRQHFATALLLAISILGVNTAFTWSNFFTTVANAQALIFTAPLFAAVLGWLLLRETIRPAHWLAVAVGITGVFVLTVGARGQGVNTALSPNPPLGNAIALVGGLLYGWYFVVARKVAQRNAAVLTSTIWQFLILSVLLSPLLFQSIARGMDPLGWTYLVIYSAVCTAGPILLLNLAGLFLPAHETSLLALSQIPFTMLAGMVIVQEFPPLLTWIGAAIIVLAGFLGARARH